jgi:hypothetical protein
MDNGQTADSDEAVGFMKDYVEKHNLGTLTVSMSFPSQEFSRWRTTLKAGIRVLAIQEDMDDTIARRNCFFNAMLDATRQDGDAWWEYVSAHLI